MNIRKVFRFAAFLSAACGPIWGQAPRVATLDVEWETDVAYFDDLTDPAKLAASAEPITPIIKTFMPEITIADIVAVNGKPVRGSWVFDGRVIQLFPSPMPGQAVGDIGRGAIGQTHLEILQSDGTRVGSIMTSGFSGGPAPPGLPPSYFLNFAVIGGTGAYLGARGALTTPGAANRPASMAEDPARRRANGGTRAHFVVYLIPMSWPDIVTTAGEPAVFHVDFSPVTETKPARAGETLIVTATGLGPTIPVIDPGRPFPSDPPAVINSPLEVTVNGNVTDVVNKIGWPGSTDTYRLDIRVPNETPPGMAALQVTAAFIAGGEVRIPIQ